MEERNKRQKTSTNIKYTLESKLLNGEQIKVLGVDGESTFVESHII